MISRPPATTNAPNSIKLKSVAIADNWSCQKSELSANENWNVHRCLLWAAVDLAAQLLRIWLEQESVIWLKLLLAWTGNLLLFRFRSHRACRLRYRWADQFTSTVAAQWNSRGCYEVRISEELSIQVQSLLLWNTTFKSLISDPYVNRLNSTVRITTHNVPLNSENAMDIIANYDIVLDATDNVATRYLLNDACVLGRKPLVSGSALQVSFVWT